MKSFLLVLAVVFVQANARVADWQGLQKIDLEELKAQVKDVQNLKAEIRGAQALKQEIDEAVKNHVDVEGLLEEFKNLDVPSLKQRFENTDFEDIRNKVKEVKANLPAFLQFGRQRRSVEEDAEEEEEAELQDMSAFLRFCGTADYMNRNRTPEQEEEMRQYMAKMKAEEDKIRAAREKEAFSEEKLLESVKNNPILSGFQQQLQTFQTLTPGQIQEQLTNFQNNPQLQQELMSQMQNPQFQQYIMQMQNNPQFQEQIKNFQLNGQLPEQFQNFQWPGQFQQFQTFEMPGRFQEKFQNFQMPGQFQERFQNFQMPGQIQEKFQTLQMPGQFQNFQGPQQWASLQGFDQIRTQQFPKQFGGLQTAQFGNFQVPQQFSQYRNTGVAGGLVPKSQPRPM